MSKPQKSTISHFCELSQGLIILFRSTESDKICKLKKYIFGYLDQTCRYSTSPDQSHIHSSLSQKFTHTEKD